MSTLTNNILTITEPTIEVDPFDIPDVETGNQGENAAERNKKNNTNASKVAGGLYPAIRINEYDFNQNDIRYFSLSFSSFLPELRVAVADSRGVFNLSQYPKDGDVLSLQIRSADEEVFKSIRMDFDIINVDAPPVSSASQGAPAENESNPGLTPVVYTFECRIKIPNLFTETCEGFPEATTFNHFLDVAEDLQLGFASNVDDTNDAMPRICAFDTKYKFLVDHTQSCYKSDNHFFTSYIDGYYYLNLVDLNNQFQYDESLDDTLVSLINDLSDKSTFTGEEAIGEGKLFLTNLEKGSQGTDRYIQAYALQNNAAEVTLLNGYKRTAQYYDDGDKKYREFEIDPLTSENLPPDLNPLRGRMDEDRYKNEVKYKYLGKQTSVENNGHEHENFLYAQLHNYQNMQEINKMYVTVDMAKANMALYRYQKIPVIIYETDTKRTDVMKQREEKNENEGTPPRDDKGVQGDAQKEMYGAPKLNKFMTGIYVIGAIEYRYSRGASGIKQKLTLMRREWPHPI